MSASGAWVFSARLHGPENGDRRPHQRRRRANHGRAVRRVKGHLACFYMIDAEDLDSALGRATKVSEAIDRPIEVRPFAGFTDQPCGGG